MSTHGCACQRLNQIESSLIRTRALLVQQEKQLLALQDELELQAARTPLDATAGIETLESLERRAIERALRLKEPQEAARLLGIGKTTLYRKLHEYGWDLRLFSAHRSGGDITKLLPKTWGEI